MHKSISCLYKWLNSVLSPRIKVIDSLSYADAIKYFVNDKPDDNRIVKGCLLIQEHKLGMLTVWTFLGKNNDVLCAGSGVTYGRELIVKSIDDELKETLGDSKLLIIE